MSRWKHKKRGSVYVVFGEATVQNSSHAMIKEGDKLVIYVSDHDGRMWARPYAEFHDGRFEEIE